MQSRRTMVRLAAALLSVGTAVALAGCTSDPVAGSPSVSAGSPGASGAAAQLPESVRSKGYITVVTDVTYPPFGFRKADGAFTGIDVDTAAALQPLLGVQVKVVNAGFDAFIPGLQAGRYDAGFNGISDTPERRKVVDFIDFNQYGGLFLTRPDSALKFTDSSVACGVKVGAEKGSDTITFLKAISTTCTSNGEKAVDTVVFGSQSDALVALSSGRVEAVLGPSTAGYLAERSGGKYVVNGPLQKTVDGGYDVGGLALKKASPLTPALLTAMKKLYDDGTLAGIYKKYGISTDGLTPPRAIEG